MGRLIKENQLLASIILTIMLKICSVWPLLKIKIQIMQIILQ